MEPLVILGRRAVAGLCFPADASHHLSNDHEINDQRRRQERVLAHVEQADGLVAAHEDLGIIFVQCALVVSDCWHVLDDHGVIRVFARLIQDRVRLHHVVDDVGFGYLLGSELLLRAQILTIVVAEVVVAGNRGEFEASIDHEVCECRFHLRLPGLEVVSTNECTMLLGQLDRTGDERVLRRSIDERCILKDTCNRKYSGGRYFLMAGFDGLHQVVCSVIDPGNKVCIAFGVCSPLDDDFFKAMGSLEIPAEVRNCIAQR